MTPLSFGLSFCLFICSVFWEQSLTAAAAVAVAVAAAGGGSRSLVRALTLHAHRPCCACKIGSMNIPRIITLDIAVDILLDIEPDSFADAIVALLALIVTTVFGTPMHVLSGYLVGLEVTRQTHFMRAALYTFFIRSLFMVNIFVWCKLFITWQPIMIGA